MTKKPTFLGKKSAPQTKSWLRLCCIKARSEAAEVTGPGIGFTLVEVCALRVLLGKLMINHANLTKKINH